MNKLKLQGLAKRLRLAESRLYKIVNTADRRGYTGMVRSRGAFTDDPIYRKAMRHYDKAFEDLHRATQRARRKTKTRGSR